MTKQANNKEETKETMDFGPVYTQFEGKTKEAMMHLSAVKTGIYLEGKDYRLIVTTEWYGVKQQLLLTAFDLRPISRKNPQRAREMKKAPKR